MWKNSKKAIEEHDKKKSDAYASLHEALPSIDAIFNNTPTSSLTFKYSVAEAQGPRPKMEDAHFFQETDQGIIMGVLDGHGGAEVAHYASTEFQERFFAILKQTNRNVHQTFEILIDEIHKEIVRKPEWNNIGTTVVISFIDKQTHQIYTATLGDSEANIYRSINEQLKSIPLSCVRDWSSKSDARRASVALEDPKIAIDWPNSLNPKYLRYPSPYYGINVSRSIGDVSLTGTVEKPGVIHKPKITVSQLKLGDILILGCDGLKDYVSENEIISVLKENKTDQANKLVRYAIDKRNSRDNVTVLVVSIS